MAFTDSASVATWGRQRRRQRRRHWQRRRLLLLPLLLPAVLLLSAGCPDTLAPPQYPGFIRMAEKGRKGVALDAAGGTALIHWWDCAIRVEPYATERLSIPIKVAGGWGLGITSEEWGAMRIGLRYRVGDLLVFGGGLSGVVQNIRGDVNEGITGYFSGWGFGDLEAGIGRRWGIFALSFAVRPSVGFGPKNQNEPELVPYFMVPAALSMAIYFSKKRRIAAVTVSIDGRFGRPLAAGERVFLGWHVAAGLRFEL